MTAEAAALLLALFVPLAGAILMWVLAPAGRDVVRYTALGAALLTLICAGYVVRYYPVATSPEVYAVTDWSWMADARFDVRFSVGLDGLGVWMFGLSALLFVTAILVSWEAIRDREPLFYAMLLLLEFGCLGVFSARDLILFYVFFEFTLIPLFFLIGIWGSEERRYAAIKFFLYTLAGSLLTFLGLLAIVLWDYHHSGLGHLRFSIPELTAAVAEHPMPRNMQIWVFLALFAGFAIKVPLFPVHTWLPLAHVQAPTAGSVILAGVLLKIGVYGFARFSMPMLPHATIVCTPWILWLSVAGIIYGALVALAQSDIKRLIAYSSVSHLGYCMLGLFSLNGIGMHGGLLQMVNHGLSTGGLFAVVGMLYERYHTREIRQLGGLARRTPWLAFFMLVFTFSSIGLPGLNGFVGEFMILLGMFQRAWEGVTGLDRTQGLLVAVLAVSGVVLGAWYMLQLVQSVFFGPLKEPGGADHGDSHSHDEVTDMTPREIAALAPLVVFIVWIGLKPHDFLPALDRPVRTIVVAAERADAARTAALGDVESDHEVVAPEQTANQQEIVARVR
jgi:NADH-quinone oxidoreductase subunit M